MFNIDRNLCKISKLLVNNKKNLKLEDFRYGFDNLSKIYNVLNKYKLVFLIPLAQKLFNEFKKKKINIFFK